MENGWMAINWRFVVSGARAVWLIRSNCRPLNEMIQHRHRHHTSSASVLHGGRCTDSYWNKFFFVQNSNSFDCTKKRTQTNILMILTSIWPFADDDFCDFEHFACGFFPWQFAHVWLERLGRVPLFGTFRLLPSSHQFCDQAIRPTVFNENVCVFFFAMSINMMWITNGCSIQFTLDLLWIFTNWFTESCNMWSIFSISSCLATTAWCGLFMRCLISPTRSNISLATPGSDRILIRVIFPESLLSPKYSAESNENAIK